MCKTKFEPHAPAAESLTPHHLTPHQMMADISDDDETASSIAAAAPTPPEETKLAVKPDFPDLLEIWQQHDGAAGDETNTRAQDKAARPKDNFPTWMRRDQKPKATLKPSENTEAHRQGETIKEAAQLASIAGIETADELSNDIAEEIADEIDNANLIDDEFTDEISD